MQHLEEGTIHAWLDGQLSPNEASAVEIHVQTCEHCARAVAEARGLVAASSRILGALDDVPAVQTSAPASGTKRRRAWSWGRAGVGYAAAATLLLAVGTTLVWRSMSSEAAYRQAAQEGETAAAVSLSAPAADSAASFSARRQLTGRENAPRAATEGRAGALANESVEQARAKKSVPTEPQKEELSVDRVVPLPGPPPRPSTPAAPPPSVRRDEAQKTRLADVAANAPQRAQDKLAGAAVVQGRVLDASTGAPIVGAVVRIDSTRQATSTDSEGKFQLQQVPLGRQTVDVRALGYQPAQHPVAVTAKDSVQQLGLMLQKANAQLENVVVTGAASAVRARAAEAPGVRADGELARVDPAAIAGCYLLRVTVPNERDADRKNVQSIPGRVQLGVSPFDEEGRRRALTLDGVGRAQSWRLLGNALELTWRDSTGQYAARLVRSGSQWIGTLLTDQTVGIIMEHCSR